MLRTADKRVAVRWRILLNEISREDAFERLISELEELGESRDSEQFFTFLARLRVCAEEGGIEAATILAELLAGPGPAQDYCDAYKWFYIGLSQSGYSIAFEDVNKTPPHYCGPVGDFRNESLVSDLVVELGFEKVRELDAEAAAWLDANGEGW